MQFDPGHGAQKYSAQTALYKEAKAPLHGGGNLQQSEQAFSLGRSRLAGIL
jgi:hypothetical protein